MEREYALGFLRRNPVVATYLGAVGLDESPADIAGRLRDHSPNGLKEEDRWVAAIDRELAAIDPSRLPSNSPRPGSCKEAADPAKKRACTFGEHAIYRCSKRPTQAVAYRLGRGRGLDLRAAAQKNSAHGSI